MKTNPTFGNLWFRFGTNYFGKHCESSSRIESDPKGCHYFGHKTIIRKNDFTIGAVGVV